MNATTGSQHSTVAFFALINHPLKMKAYLLKNLPSAAFSGLRVTAATEAACTVSVPYKWFTKNPFRSTYFACLSMAAELSTGVLAMAQVYNRRQKVAMLVTGVEAQFFKKAVGVTFFSCADGEAIKTAIETAVALGQAQVVTVTSTGKSASGEAIAEFRFTWSFKAKV